jgi:diguanylate cyclase (GGDEF)-like protein
MTALATNPAVLVGVVLALVLLVLAIRLVQSCRTRAAAAMYARQLTDAANTGSIVGATVVPIGRPRPKATMTLDDPLVDEVDSDAAVDETAVHEIAADGGASGDATSGDAASGDAASGDAVSEASEPAAERAEDGPTPDVDPATAELTDAEIAASEAAHIERRRLPRRRALRSSRRGRRGSRGRRADDINQTLLADPVRVPAAVAAPPSVIRPAEPAVAPVAEVVPPVVEAVTGAAVETAADVSAAAETAAASVPVTQVTTVGGGSPAMVMVDVVPVTGDARVPQPRPEPPAPEPPASVLRPEDLLDPIDEFAPSDELHMPQVHVPDPSLPWLPPLDPPPSDAPLDSLDQEPVDPFVSAPIFGAAPLAPANPQDPGGLDPTDRFDPTAPTGLPETFPPTAPTGLPELFDPGPAEVAYPATHLDQGYLAELDRSDDIGGWAADRSDEEIWQMTAPSQETGAGAGVVTDAQTEVSATMPQVAVSLPQVTDLVEHSGMVQPSTPENEAPSDGTSWAAAPAQTWTTPSSQDVVEAPVAPVAPAAQAAAPSCAPVPVYVPAAAAPASGAARGNWWDNDGRPSTPAATTATASAVEAAIAISQAYAPRPERQASAANGSSFGKVVLDFEPRTPNEDGEEVVNRIVSQILASVGVDPAAVARHQTIDEMPDWAFDAPRIPSQRGVTPSTRQRDGLRRAAKRLTTAATRPSAAQITAEEAALLVDGDVAAVVVHSVEGPRVLWLHPEGGESQIWGPQTLSALLAAGAPVREVLEADPLADGATTALLAVPIASAGTLAGTLVVRRLRAEGFTIAEQGVLDRLARMTGASLDAIARRGALAGDEDLDPVTGLVRRERMLVDLRTAVRTRAEHDLPVSLVLAEVDGLARMRTEFGDADADEALRLIAMTLNSQLRVGDIAYRHGEDDVAVLLPATELDDAEIVAGRLAGAAEQILAERFKLPRPLRLRTAAVPVEEDAAKTLEQAIIMLGAERNHERQVIEAAQRRRLAAELEQR